MQPALVWAGRTWRVQPDQPAGDDGSVTTTIWTDNNFSKKSKCEYSAIQQGITVLFFMAPLHGMASNARKSITQALSLCLSGADKNQ